MQRCKALFLIVLLFLTWTGTDRAALADAELTAVMFDTLLGDDLNARKAFIAAHGAEYMKTADI